jgi:hypothetical protein
MSSILTTERVTTNTEVEVQIEIIYFCQRGRMAPVTGDIPCFISIHQAQLNTKAGTPWRGELVSTPKDPRSS